jgi:hypothetical protein
MRCAVISLVCLFGTGVGLADSPAGTSFTYQGVLAQDGTPLTGSADLKFTLWDAHTGGDQVNSTVTRNGVAVTNGQFTVALDFGSDAFNGDSRWLAIAVRSPAGTGEYTSLTPRQPVNPVPYALHALNAATHWSPVTGGIEYTTDETVWIKPPDGVTNGTTRTLALRGARSGNLNPIATIDIHNYDDNNGGFPYIAAQITSHNRGTVDEGDLNFFTRADALTQKMTITPDGDVGIGTNDPQARLHVNEGDAHISGGDFYLDRGSADAGLTRTLTIGGARDLGGQDYAALQFQNYDSGAGGGDYVGAKIASHNANAADSGDLRFFSYDGAFNLGMTIAPDGKVGVGKSNPTSLLDVNGKTTTNNLEVSGKTTTNKLDVNDGILVPAGGIRNAGARPGTDDLGIYSLQDGLWVRFVSNDGSFVFYTDSDEGKSLTPDPQLAAMMITNDGRVGIGTPWPQEKLEVAGKIQADVLILDGGADLSEKFDVHGDVRPGLVVSIDPKRPGQLAISAAAYDRRVAGVISGAGDVKPGLLLGQEGSVADGEHAVALTGRVYCWADATDAPIEPGDLLTTSDIPGHAMKVRDHDRAPGATIGKAMTALPEGRGLVLVLVNLQ